MEVEWNRTGMLVFTQTLDEPELLLDVFLVQRGLFHRPFHSSSASQPSMTWMIMSTYALSNSFIGIPFKNPQVCVISRRRNQPVDDRLGDAAAFFQFGMSAA
jgi:hypothetical protein